MNLHRQTATALTACAVLAWVGACGSGPSVTGSFERTFTVSGHTRLDLTTPSGDVSVTGSADGKVHVHGDVRVWGMSLSDANKELANIDGNPPLEQTPDGVRIGKEGLRLHDVSISYTVEVPRDTEVNSSTASGAQAVRNLRGPIKLQSASGSVRAEDIDGEAQLTSASGSVSASNMGDVVRATSFSGDVNINGAKGDVRATDESGNIQIAKPGARVDASDTSGNITVQGATVDVKAHSVSGNVTVRGNLSPSSYWDLRSISGNAEIGVPANSNFHLLAESTSGEIRADIPIMIEEQGKHSLRAQIGTGGGRVEAHSISGEIHLTPSN
jgi:DUF4097 and DUF4098 domain-containing protein YvlB